ncbi:2-succinylbenzoate--CoA ligase [Kordia antarctica]|uniref:2-succinylbenzoate--CoA ligase n=1 Tax=Kordia antarctica TaxID=1218801 RepID=A0A7L4ZQI9_9FLAO|nr:class I adenylate-forming enzyme family protein [Kordia antarctica]QHI38915.1 2-succinylbenzoate--CoA ligase [Kordia antarctica]
MNLYKLLANRKPTETYLQTESASYTFAELFVFVKDFEKQFLAKNDEVIALKIKNQALLVFCIWACIKHQKSFVLLPFQIDTTLEKSLLIDASCSFVISTKEEKVSSKFSVNDLTLSQLKNQSENHQTKTKKVPSIGFISSGTTGKPKLIWNTFLQFEKSLEAIRKHDFMPYCENQQVMISPFLTHSYGFSALLEYTHQNSTLVIPSEATFSSIFRLITNKKIKTIVTAIEGVPYFYKQLLVFKKKVHFSNLKHIGFGGDFVHETVLKSLHEIYNTVSFSIRYGISEIPSVIGLNRFESLDKNTNTYSILPVYSINITDEILVNSIDDSTKIATGDIGVLVNEKLKIIDRKASFLKVKGYKISPSYIEKVILDSEMIQEVQVLAKNDTLIANIIPLSNYKKTELINFLQQNLPNYSLPDFINEVKSLVRTATGKISRH